MKTKRCHQRGIALIVVLIFVAVFSTFSVCMLTMTSSSVIAADNVHQGNEARICAESGLETVRYYAEQVTIPATTNEDQRYNVFIETLHDYMHANNIRHRFDDEDPENKVLYIGTSDWPVTLDASSGKIFYSAVSEGTDRIIIQVTGKADSLERTIVAGFSYGTRPETVFDYGVATKGPLELDGGTLTSSTVKSESDVYIESMNDPKALAVLKSKSEISGVAKIVNENADISASDIVGTIGGLSGSNAIANSIEIGVAPTEFPYPDAAHFEQYVTGGTYSSGSTLTNMRIASGSDLKFTGDTVINGILYIESPNTIEFGGNVTVNGMIVCEGDWTDNSGTSSLSFTGSVDSMGLPAEGSEYDGLRGETGTFLMAPGFGVSFTGSFGTIGGAIAANGISFSGNAGGIIEGSVINYADTKMTVDGSSDIVFNRSGITEIPAGFVQELVIHYDADTYEEKH